MKIPENWTEKMIMGIQALLVVVYVWFTFQQEIKQKQKAAKRIQGQREKEAIRYNQVKFKQKKKLLKSRNTSLKKFFKSFV